MSKPKQWRIGLISDLHGNLVATQTVLAALTDLGIKQVLCMGDVATSGPQPHETVVALRALHCPVVMGNTDAWALNPQPFVYRNAETPIVYAIEEWGAQQLDADDRTFLQTFAPTIQVELGATTVLCYHGSPRSFMENIRATTPDEEMATIFADHTATIVIGGHTHTQMVRRYGEMLVVNPGSVGMAVAVARGATQGHHPPWAEFGILEVSETAQGPSLHVELHRTPIDVAAVIRAAETSGMPHAAWYIDHWQRGVNAL